MIEHSHPDGGVALFIAIVHVCVTGAEIDILNFLYCKCKYNGHIHIKYLVFIIAQNMAQVHTLSLV